MSHSKVSCVLGCLVLVSSAGLAHADTFPQSTGEMKHVLIAFDGTNIDVSMSHHGPPLPLELRNFGESHTAPADVLDGKWYNDQYGIMADGVFSPPTGAAFYLELVDPVAGLDVYAGGRRSMRATHTYAPIMGTDGSPSSTPWNGMMTHHWFATATPGPYEAVLRVYLGDELTGAPLSGYGADTLALTWVPAPSAMVAMGLGLACAAHRRRRDQGA